MTFIYNEACLQLFGERHPPSLGCKASVPWPEVWSNLSPLVETAFQGRPAQRRRDPPRCEQEQFRRGDVLGFYGAPGVQRARLQRGRSNRAHRNDRVRHRESSARCPSTT
ncbi:hypothetical protein MRB53_040767 [Persea americana]|nr:hypothetical protein MRB53_040767 [Persea americana]